MNETFTRNNSHPLTSARLKPSACASIGGGFCQFHWYRIIFPHCPPGRLAVESVIDVPLAGIDSAAAQASVEADLTAIRLAIQSFSGGFETLDEVVRQQLRQWFESQGGIKVAGSFARGNSTSSANSKTATTPGGIYFQYAVRSTQAGI